MALHIKVSKFVQAAIAAVTIAGANLTALATDPDVVAVLPSSALQWLTLGATTLTGSVLPFLVRNKPTVEEAEELLIKATDRLS